MSLDNHRHQELLKILSKHFNCFPVRQSGSHIVVENPNGRIASVPAHSRPIKIGTLRSILSQLGISEEEFRKHL